MHQTSLVWTMVISLVVLSAVLIGDVLREWRRKLMRARRMRRIRKHRNIRSAHSGSDVGDKPAPNGEDQPCVDLLGAERPTMLLILPPDGKQLHLLPPTKAVSDQFEVIGQLLERMEHCRLSMDGIDQLYKFASILISCNKEGCGFTKADLKERCSCDEIGTILQEYLQWLFGLLKSKN